MAAKETIALVGIANEICTGLVNKLAQGNYRLLLVSNDEKQLEQLSNQVMQHTPGAEVESIDCVKNGCWEADIIVLLGAANFEEELIDRIKVFATQKLVVGISVHQGKIAAFKGKNIQHLLPNSKVVHVFNTSASTEAFIAGDDAEAIQTVSDLTRTVGYHPTTVDSFQAITKL